MTTPTRTLRLSLSKGDAHKIKVEKYDKLTDSPFSEVYDQAIMALREIHADNTLSKESKEKTGQRLMELNPVIGFCGERGSGKTSAMVSFRNLLQDWHEVQKLDTTNPYLTAFGSDKVRFICLETVDPSRFEPHDRLIGSILGELYRRFDAHLNSREYKGDVNQQRKVEEAFKSALEVVQLLSNDKAHPFGTPGAGENSFEILKRAGKAADARSVIHTLIEELLNFFQSSGNEKDSKFPKSDGYSNYLVIPIDDLDMSVQHAYVLAEDIRKYFMVPNVIILLAAKVDQLRMAVEQSYVERFKDYRRELQKPDQEEIESMSNLYLEKLLPLGKRIPMPDLSRPETSRSMILQWYSGSSGTPEEGPIETIVLGKVFSSSGLVFINQDRKINPMVPRTLRELSHFLQWLDDVDTQQKAMSSLQKVSRFRTYFLQEWVPRNLDRADEQLILELEAVQLNQKNKRAIQLLGKRTSSKLLAESDQWKEFIQQSHHLRRISKFNVQKQSVSLGDVRLLLDYLEQLSVSQSDENFIFAIKTLYSLTILEIWNEFENEKFNSSEIEEKIATFLNGAWVHPKQYNLFDPASLVDKTLLNQQYASIELDRLTITKGSGKNNILPAIISIADASSNSQTGKQSARRMLSLFLYLGNAGDILENGDNSARWYNAAFIGGIGRDAEYFTLDLWAFLFWLMLPQLSKDRFSDESDNADSNSQGDEFAYLTRNSLFFQQVLQIDVIDAVGEWMRQRYLRDTKNSQHRNKRSISYAIQWMIRNFTYALKILSKKNPKYLISPPHPVDLFSTTLLNAEISKLEYEKSGISEKIIDKIFSNWPQDTMSISQFWTLFSPNEYVNIFTHLDQLIPGDSEYTSFTKTLEDFERKIQEVNKIIPSITEKDASDQLKTIYNSLIEIKSKNRPWSWKEVRSLIIELQNLLASQGRDSNIPPAIASISPKSTTPNTEHKKRQLLQTGISFLETALANIREN